MLIKHLCFDGDNFNGGGHDTEFTAYVLVHGNANGDPLAPLKRTDGH
jgi:hypothetical protein